MKTTNILKNVIDEILNNENLEELLNYCENDIFFNGPINTTTLEILSLIKELQYDFFIKHESKIIRLMGLFFKSNNNEITDLQQFIMEKYRDSILSIRQNKKFTPMQNEIISKIQNCKNYSFSSPTSTGKSYIFRYLIENAKKDVMIVVPSRALINEFYIKVSEYIKDKATMVLTFVDDINKKHTKKHIFILTPERARDVFKYKHIFDFEFFLFDEAQLTNEEDERGMYYDGIVRRLKDVYSNSNFIFAHPFIKNPDAQFIKNNFNLSECKFNSYNYKNTGQIFVCHEKENFYAFGIDKKILGETKVLMQYDPIDRVLSSQRGCILIYTAKTRIIKKTIFKKFENYIDKYCIDAPNEEMLEIINQIEPYIGASEEFVSFFIKHLKRGIVFHHGSMPLDVRILLEKYINKGYCKICFATSTLAQGINMPFDLIYIDKFETSKPLQLRNIIGRAGRSSEKAIFDYGIVVVKKDNMSDLRNIINYEEQLEFKSMLDREDLIEEHKEYKDAITNNDFSDEYNLPNKVVQRAENDNIIESSIDVICKNIDYLKNKYNRYFYFEKINEQLNNIYKNIVLPLRDLTAFEKIILRESNKLMLYRYLGFSFAQICINRYYKVKNSSNPQYSHGYIPQFTPIPNSKKNVANNLFGKNDVVDYDTVVYDTYDYFDKLIDLKIIDVYYVAFMKYYEKCKNEKIKNIATKLKYGTDVPKEIMILRYGFVRDDFPWLNEVISFIDEEEIIFNKNVSKLDEYKKEKIKKYLF